MAQRLGSLGPLLAALVALLAYGNALGPSEFVYDDLPLIAWNERIHDLGRLGEHFTTSYWGDPNHGVYRPLTLVSLALNYAAVGPDPRGFVLVNVLLHAAASALVVLLARSLGARPLAGVAAGLLFAAHPVHVEAVAWGAGRAELLCACASLLALVLHRRAGRAEHAAARRRGWALAGAALAAGLLSKEHAATVLVAAVVLDALVPPLGAGEGADPRARRSALRQALPAYAFYGGLLLTYLLVRTLLFGAAAWSPRYVMPIDNFLAPEVSSALGNVYGLPPLEGRLTAVANLSDAARLLLAPARLSVDYSFGVLAPARSVLDPRFLLGAFCLSLVAATPLLAWRRAPLVAAGAALLGLTYVPASNLLVTIGTPLGERLLYLPSVGLCLVAGAAFARAASGQGPRARARTSAALALGAIVLLLGAGRTWTRSADWRDRVRLWEATLDAVPTSPRAHLKLGGALLDRLVALRRLPAEGQPEPQALEALERRAMHHLERSLALYPEGANVNLALVELALRRQQPARALLPLARATVLAPLEPRLPAFWRLALATPRRRAQTPEALEGALALIERGLTLRPAPTLLLARAHVGLALGRRGAAEADLRALLAAPPGGRLPAPLRTEAQALLEEVGRATGPR